MAFTSGTALTNTVSVSAPTLPLLPRPMRYVAFTCAPAGGTLPRAPVPNLTVR
ncbi:hypothetical protein D3C83_85010 [compost metagenome]